MNPFVNPNNRDVTLPAGCKDLIDVLKQPGPNAESGIVPTPVSTQMSLFIHLLLFQAQQDGATEIVICPDALDGMTPIRCKIKGAWHDMAPFPSHFRPSVINRLAEMAKFPAGQTLGNGLLEIQSASVHLKWTVTITSAEGDCTLVRAT